MANYNIVGKFYIPEVVFLRVSDNCIIIIIIIIIIINSNGTY
jgi:hypothetical protein